MKISAKTRYGISALICLAREYNATECTTVISLSEKLKISKMYLEQVFALLKRTEIVVSTKGSQGGYHLSRPPKEITIYEIFAAIETSMMEKTKPTVSDSDESIETAMHTVVFDRLDDTIRELLSDITLEDLLNESEKYNATDSYMYYL